MNLDRWAESLNQLMQCWDDFCSALQDTASAFERLWKELWPFAYEEKNTPPIKYGTKTKKNHIYHTKMKPYHGYYRNLRNQPYCRRIFM